MKLQSIQALRGLAALLVVVYHTRTLELKGIAENGLTEPAFISGLFTNGYAGVDLFFVISGFIMVFVTHGSPIGPRSASSFLFARATRIYPVWWVFAAIITLYMFATQQVTGQSAVWDRATQGIPVVPYLVKSFLLQPQPALPVLNVGWTLIHEIYFYLMFTLFMLAPRRWLPVLLGIWAVIVVGGSLLGYLQPVPATWGSLVLHPMTLEFILGATAGLAVTKGLVWRSGVLTLVATLWLLTALCYQGEETSFQLIWGRVFWFGLPSTLLVYGCAGLDVRQRHGWLLPAFAAFLVTLALYQMTGLNGYSPEAARRTGTLLTVAAGGIAMAAVLWSARLMERKAPDRLQQARSASRRLMDVAVKLGDWSFSLYLCHLIILSALRQVFGLLGQVEPLAPVFRLGDPGALDNLAFAAASVPLCVIGAWVSYRWYERPFTRFFGRLRASLFERDRMEPASA